MKCGYAGCRRDAEEHQRYCLVHESVIRGRMKRGGYATDAPPVMPGCNPDTDEFDRGRPKFWRHHGVCYRTIRERHERWEFLESLRKSPKFKASHA
ncbi:MAG: hypothetical protein WC683_05865 [bacterium]